MGHKPEALPLESICPSTASVLIRITSYKSYGSKYRSTGLEKNIRSSNCKTGTSHPFVSQSAHVLCAKLVDGFPLDFVTAVCSERFGVNLIRVHTAQEPGQIGHYDDFVAGLITGS
jgi:hypothetical protein